MSKENKKPQNQTAETETENLAATETVETAAATESANQNDSSAKKQKKAKKSGAEKLKSAYAAKRTTFMLAIAAVTLVVLVMLNVVASVIADRLPTTWDVTADNSNSLTAENISFIKSIQSDVTITVCATRESYTGAEMVNYAANYYYVQEGTSPSNYFNQTVTMLENYQKQNGHIKVEFVDIQSPEFKNLESETKAEINYGDIIVSAVRDGEKLTSIITFTDIYELYDASGGYAAYGSGYYVIQASNLESELSSAIYTVASSKKATIALLTGHGTESASAALTERLEKFNYEIVKIDGKLKADLLKDVQSVLLVQPVSDLDGEELKVLDAFLDNNGQKGKGFLVFGSTASPATPNLNEFMEEWGIGVQDGMAFETNTAYRGQTISEIMLFNKKDALTKAVNGSELYYYCDSNLALKTLFEEKETRKTHVLLATSESAVVAPKNVPSGYNPPSSAQKGEIPVAILTGDTTYDSSYNEITSYVGYFGSADLIDANWTQYNDVGNMEFAINAVNIAGGRDSNSQYYLPKTTGSYAVSFSDGQNGFVRIVFLWLVPLTMVAVCAAVWITRKRKH